MIEEFKKTVNLNGLSESEQKELMDELEHRLSKVNDIISQEEQSQDAKLKEALAKRRKKKEEVANVLLQLSEKKNEGNDALNERL